MNTYVLNILNIKETPNEETKFTCVKSEANAYFFNLSEAVYCVQNNMTHINEKGEYNYITIVGVPTGTTYAYNNPTEFYVYKYATETNSYTEVARDAEVFKFLASLHNAESVSEKPMINLDLSKEEIVPTQQFVSELKESICNKDYNKAKSMIEQKESMVSDKINGFLNNITNSLQGVDNAVNQLFDVLNGKF